MTLSLSPTLKGTKLPKKPSKKAPVLNSNHRLANQLQFINTCSYLGLTFFTGKKFQVFHIKFMWFFVVFVWFSKNIPVWKKYLFSKFSFLFFLLWNYFSKDGKRISIETIITITILGLPQNYTWNRFIQKWKQQASNNGLSHFQELKVKCHVWK